MSRQVALVYDHVYKLHDPGGLHPERPERLDAVVQAIGYRLPEDSYTVLNPRMATADEIKLVHDGDYYDLVKEEVESGCCMLSTGDTNICPDSLLAALHAAGGLCDAVDFVMKRDGGRAFCAVRPPGHHASSGRGMGFCVFNNIAVAAEYARKTYGIRRILIADWDVHHGNGTQEIFYGDPDVFFFSTHQWPCFPGTGRRNETGTGAGAGTTLNFPFPPGSGAREIIGAYRDYLVPAMNAFHPELVLVSAGFDSRLGDSIGNFELSDSDFGALTEIVCGIADRHASGRLVSALEGGYDLKGLGLAAAEHFNGLIKDEVN